jgi:hypothetical protein
MFCFRAISFFLKRKWTRTLEKLVIEDLPVVSSVHFHAGDKTHKSGVYTNLRCGCGAKQVGPIRKSSERPTNVDCFRELGRVIQWDHGPTCIAAAQELQAAEKAAADASTKRPADEAAASLNANDVLILHRRFKMIQKRAAEANKAALEAEKERDELHNQIEQIEEQLHPKRARTDVDAGVAHEMLVEVQNWDLRDHSMRHGSSLRNTEEDGTVKMTYPSGAGALYNFYSFS